MKKHRQRRSTDIAIPDVAASAVWAYVYGYLEVLLTASSLAERLRTLTDDDRLASCPRLLLLCPTNGETPQDAKRLDGGRLVSIGNANAFTQSVAGARARQYGAHTVFRVSRSRQGQEAAAGPAESRLVAVEAVGSLRTLLVVAEAMTRCPRRLPLLTTDQMVAQFVARLRYLVAHDHRMRDAFRLVEYDPRQEGALQAAVEDAAFETAVSGVGAASDEPQPATSAAPPGEIGVYLAWSFMHGYLMVTAKQRDVSRELEQLSRETGLWLPVPRVVVLCPTGAAEWTDDIAQLDNQLKPVKDFGGVQSGVKALASRSYGSFSIYRCGEHTDGDCFALELATPLRTLRLGVAAMGAEPALYQREAARFVEELNTLLQETPDVATNYCLLEVDGGASVTDLLKRLDRSPGTPELDARGCSIQTGYGFEDYPWVLILEDLRYTLRAFIS